MNDMEKAEENPITHPPGVARTHSLSLPLGSAPLQPVQKMLSFNRDELRKIFNLYGRKVGDGEWRDYAIDFTPHKAVFIYLQARLRICALQD